MFTGIITDVGVLAAVAGEHAGGLRWCIATRLSARDLVLGASIACNGVCLTVAEVQIDQDGGQHYFFADVSPETLHATTLGECQADSMINLEAALRLGDALGGHQVSGHVDSVGVVTSIVRQGDQHTLWTFSVAEALMPYIAERGSVAVNGVSLTVIRVQGREFSVNLIPHTVKNTSFQQISLGTSVNIEVDVLARHVVRACQFYL